MPLAWTAPSASPCATASGACARKRMNSPGGSVRASRGRSQNRCFPRWSARCAGTDTRTAHQGQRSTLRRSPVGRPGHGRHSSQDAAPPDRCPILREENFLTAACATSPGAGADRETSPASRPARSFTASELATSLPLDDVALSTDNDSVVPFEKRYFAAKLVASAPRNHTKRLSTALTRWRPFKSFEVSI